MMYRKLGARNGILAVLFICTLGYSQSLRAQEAQQTPGATTPQTQAPTTPPSNPAPAASQPPPTPPQTQPKSTSESKPATAQPGPEKKKGPENDRIFFALPNYLTVENAAHLPPLTTRQKFKTVAEGCFDPVEFVFIGAEAGIGQADNTNPTYHQGFIGYTRRFGTDYADAIIGNFGTGAIFPTLLHQDPRYYQMGSGNFFHRFFHAAGRVVITRSDHEKTQFNFSEFLGNGLAAGLSNTYHPRPHTIASSADVEGTQIVLDALGYELKEFWPDLRRLLVRGKHKT